MNPSTVILIVLAAASVARNTGRGNSTSANFRPSSYSNRMITVGVDPAAPLRWPCSLAAIEPRGFFAGCGMTRFPLSFGPTRLIVVFMTAFHSGHCSARGSNTRGAFYFCLKPPCSTAHRNTARVSSADGAPTPLNHLFTFCRDVFKSFANCAFAPGELVSRFRAATICFHVGISELTPENLAASGGMSTVSLPAERFQGLFLSVDGSPAADFPGDSGDAPIGIGGSIGQFFGLVSLALWRFTPWRS